VWEAAAMAAVVAAVVAAERRQSGGKAATERPRCGSVFARPFCSLAASYNEAN